MGEDFHPAPVPISLSIRHPSGWVASYGARALAYDDSSLRVLSSEDFEKGTQLRVRAARSWKASFPAWFPRCRGSGYNRGTLSSI